MKIVYYPDEGLLKPTIAVTNFGEKLKYGVTKMFRIMKEQNGIGLAANQIGSIGSVFVVDIPFKEMNLTRVFVNPRLELSGDMISIKEGCLSFPGISVEVPRHSICKISYQDLDGKEHQEIFQGLPAIVCQHEMDHLEGKTFIDNLPALTQTEIRAKLVSK